MQKNHVIIQTAFIGDVFLSIPFLQRLREIYPQDRIIYVAKKGVADFFLKSNLIDELITIEKGNRQTYKKAVNLLNEKKIENLFCLHKSLRSSLFSLQIRAKSKFGFRKNLNFLFFTQVISYPVQLPDPIRQMSLLTFVDPEMKSILLSTDWSYLNYKNNSQHFDLIPDFFKIKKNNFKANSSEIEKKLELSIKTNKRIALFPGSVWETKKWPIEYYTKLAEELVRRNFEVIIMGGPDEVDLAQHIKRYVPSVKVVAGRLKLVESIEFMTTLDFVICNDSSPSHLAAAVGIKVIAIFGPTTLALGFRPWSDDSYVVENNNLDCRPCGLHGHHKCPLGHHKCMKDISVEIILNKIFEFSGRTV